VAQARLELAALAATLPPPPVYAPLAVEKDKPGAAAKRAKAAAATAADNDADADGANGGAAVLAADETEAALAAAVSKKPAALRRAELRRATRGPLLAAIAAEPERFATDRFASAVAESALAALHRSHCGPDKGGDGGGGKVRAVGGGVGADGADAVWDAAADALLDVAFEPVALGGAPGGATAAAAGKPSKKAKKTEAADGAPSARPRFASDVSAGRVLKRYVRCCAKRQAPSAKRQGLLRAHERLVCACCVARAVPRCALCVRIDVLQSSDFRGHASETKYLMHTERIHSTPQRSERRGSEGRDARGGWPARYARSFE
jgi:hypothetical protein